MGVKVMAIEGAVYDDLEPCCICGQPTDTWYTNKDVALCSVCADKAEHFDIPTKREWLVSQGVQLPKNWKCNADRK